MVATVERNKTGPRDGGGQATAGFERHDRVIARMENHRGDCNLRKELFDVDIT